MKKQSPLVVLIACIVVVAYNLAVFVIAGFSGHTPTFWISYGGMMLSCAFCGVFGYIGFVRGNSLTRDLFLKYPIVRYMEIFLVAEFVVTTVFLIAEKAPWAISFLLQLVLMTVYLVRTISCFVAMNTVAGVRKEIKEKTAYLGLLEADARVLVSLCTDAEVKKEFSAFAESIHYSDPMSDPALQSVETELQSCVDSAKRSLRNGDLESARDTCREMQLLLKERNEKCAVLKH